MISDELRQALSDWLAWAENGASVGDPFMRDVGLCTNLWDCGIDVGDELYALFEDEFGIHSDYPFGERDYLERQANDTMHLCPNRLAWVRKMVGAGA